MREFFAERIQGLVCWLMRSLPRNLIFLGHNAMWLGNLFLMFQRHYNPSKWWEQIIQWCNIISQNNGILNHTSVKTSRWNICPIASGTIFHDLYSFAKNNPWTSVISTSLINYLHIYPCRWVVTYVLTTWLHKIPFTSTCEPQSTTQALIKYCVQWIYQIWNDSVTFSDQFFLSYIYLQKSEVYK